MKFIITALLLITSYLSFGQTDSSKVTNNVPVSRYPEPIGGSEGLARCINKNMSEEVFQYIQKNKIKGKIYVMLVIGSTGDIKEAVIEKGLEPIIDEEILRVIWLTRWLPGYVNTIPVRIRFTLPISI